MEKLKQSQTSLTKPQIKSNQIDRRTDRQADSQRKKGFVFKSILRRKPNLHENAKILNPRMYAVHKITFVDANVFRIAILLLFSTPYL